MELKHKTTGAVQCEIMSIPQLTGLTESQLKKANEWITALESGEYQQTEGRLRSGDNYCCLGVACAISGEGRWVDETIFTHAYSPDKPEIYYELIPPKSIMFAMGMPEEGGFYCISREMREVPNKGKLLSRNLAGYNDGNISFTDIAKLIRLAITTGYKNPAWDETERVYG